MTETSETIERAAIRDHDGTVYDLPRPARHHNVIAYMAGLGIKTPISGEQGFTTNKKRYVGRVEARKIATEANQLLPRDGGLKELFSEDVWEGMYTAPEHPKEEDNMKEGNRITLVSIRVQKDTVFSLPYPNCHKDVRKLLKDININHTEEDLEEGFYTSKGEYVDKMQARSIAVQAGQVVYKEEVSGIGSLELDATDLWKSFTLSEEEETTP